MAIVCDFCGNEIRGNSGEKQFKVQESNHYFDLRGDEIPIYKSTKHGIIIPLRGMHICCDCMIKAIKSTP